MATTPSITSWVRLEPRCRDTTMREGIRARVYDPLWLLARQWQVGEFEGEDAGSPVQARWRGHSAAVTRLHAGTATPGQPVRAQRYDAAALPLEAVVERRSVRAAGPFDTTSSIRLAAESGLHFLRLLGAQQMSRSYRRDFITRFALEGATDSERLALDGETLDYWDLMAGRVPDGRLLVEAWRAADGQRLPLPAEPAVAAGDRAEVNAAIDAWLAYYDSLFSEPADGSDAWQRERMEYAFSLGAGETTLTAAEYHGGHLDWHSVDVDPALQLGAAQDNASADVVRTVMPAPVSFRGAPAQRFWEFEDARVDFGLLPAGPGDLPHLLLSDFATNYGNDWYVIPIDLAVGTLTRTRSLVVSDTFGVQTLIKPHNADGPSAFSMYSLATLRRPPPPDTVAAAVFTRSTPVANLFYLAPSLFRSIDSTPRDEVLLLRDEMANMAWAVERLMQGRVEQRIDLAVAAQSTTNAADGAGSSTPVYRLATDVPENWVPLIAQRQPAPDNSLRLVRARLLRADGSNAARIARGAILSGPPLKLYDEELPREGARIVRGYQCTRWIGGQTVLWLALRKSVGRGEGASGLRFDGIEP
jgi:hypothetical protein